MKNMDEYDLADLEYDEKKLKSMGDYYDRR